LEACCRDWVEAIRTVIPGEVIAIDGKTRRRSHDHQAAVRGAEDRSTKDSLQCLEY